MSPLVTNAPGARFHFPYIDVARAVAVLLVLVYHLIVVLPWPLFPSSGIFDIFRIGWIGVDLFFVISGFVISLSLARTVERFGPKAYLKPYFRNRLARILPLYFLTSWCYLVLVDPQLFNIPSKYFWGNLLSHAFCVHNMTGYAGALNGPAWTIAIEMQFYILMALVFRWLPVHRPILVCVLFIAVALAWRAGVWYTFDPGLDVSNLVSRTQMQLPGTLDAFGLGCAMALIVRDPQHALHRCWRANWKNALVWLVIAMLLSVASWRLFWSHPAYWTFYGMVIFYRLLLAITFAAWVGCLIALPYDRILAGILAPASYIGKISYGIYLWHMLVIMSVLKIGIARPVRAAELVVVLTLVIAAFSWHFFEHPLIRKYHDKPAPSP